MTCCFFKQKTADEIGTGDWSSDVFFFFKQKTAYEIGTGDWSSDVCSSDLQVGRRVVQQHPDAAARRGMDLEGDKANHSHDVLALTQEIVNALPRALVVADGEIGRASCRERV